MAKMFTTPTDIPEGVACRTLRIPNDGIWLGIFNSALLETVNQYNWEQTFDTDLTIEETVAKCAEIIQTYWDEIVDCAGPMCMTPEGTRIIRLGVGGHLQQMGVDGWEAPTDDYEVPPVPAREEATAEERKCLASANAANVLQMTYEQVTDAIAIGADEAEIRALMIAFTIATLGLWAGLALEAIVWLSYALFIAFVEIAEEIGEDVWTVGFTDKLRCLLYGCATDTADVVTFDFDCFMENYAATVDLFSPEGLAELRLYGQIVFMLSCIGVDGLNAAGATTAITDSDCDDCDSWCYRFDFEVDDGGFDAPFCGVYASGIGWQTGYFNDGTSGYRIVEIVRPFTSADLTTIQVYYTLEAGTIYPPAQNYIYRDSGAVPNRIHTWGLYATGEYVETWTGIMNEDNVGIVIYSGFNAPSVTDPGGQVTIKRITFRGTGTNPFGGDNC